MLPSSNTGNLTLAFAIAVVPTLLHKHVSSLFGTWYIHLKTDNLDLPNHRD